MTLHKVIRKLLKLSFLKVAWVEFRNRNRELHLGVKPFKNGCLCPKCGRRCKILRFLDKRVWRDVVVCGIPVFFHYSPKEVLCPTHGPIMERIPWADYRSRVTYRLELMILTLTQQMTQKAVSGLVKIPPSTLSELIHRVIHREREGHKIRGLKVIGIDEISYAKGRKFITLVYDMERGCVVWIGKGKGKETIDSFFTKELSQYQRDKIQVACCDMAKAYISSIKEHCKNATLVLDKFHIIQSLNKAVDAVRKDVWREACKTGRQAIKGVRWLIAYSSASRSQGQTRKINLLEKSNNKIYRAWLLKDNFEHFWDYVSPGHAANFLNAWITRALRSRIDSMKEFALMLRRHQDNILSFIKEPVTNARAEGINRLLKIIKNRSSGFKSLQGFENMIHLCAGDLDIVGSYPRRFCTL